jgi:hypothetical protein
MNDCTVLPASDYKSYARTHARTHTHTHNTVWCCVGWYIVTIVSEEWAVSNFRAWTVQDLLCTISRSLVPRRRSHIPLRFQIICNTVFWALDHWRWRDHGVSKHQKLLLTQGHSTMSQTLSNTTLWSQNLALYVHFSRYVVTVGSNIYEVCSSMIFPSATAWLCQWLSNCP